MRGLALIGLMLAAPAVAPAVADTAFVTAQVANQVALIDTDTGATQAVAVPGAPAPVAFDPASGLAYVVSADIGRITGLRRDGSVATTFEAGRGTFGIAVAGDGGLVLGDWFANRLRRLGPDMTELWSVPTGHAPTGIVAANGLVAVAERDDDSVAIFDLGNGALVGRARVGAHPFGFAAHEGRFYSANVEDASISVITPDGQEATRIAVGNRPYGVAFAAGRGFVTNQGDGTISVFDVATNRVIDTLTVGDYPEGITVLSDGRIAFVQWFDNLLSVLDPQTLAVVANYDTPGGPRAFGGFTAP